MHNRDEPERLSAVYSGGNGVKGLGAALVTLAGVLTGVFARKTLMRTAQRRKTLCQMLSLLAFELERFQRPLPELFRSLGQRLSGPAGVLCCQVGMQLGQGMPFAQTWAEQLQNLPMGEREILTPLGQVLGRYGASEQLAAAAQCRREMEAAYTQACLDVRERGRIYMGLSAVGGMMLAILMM